MLGGLGLQLFVGLIYLSLFASFTRRYFSENSCQTQSRIYQLCMIIMINNIVFIVYPPDKSSNRQMRTIYRMVEFGLLARNNSNQINEVYLYIFDALPTLVGSLAYAFSLPYELPYRQVCKRRCTTTACNGGTESIEITDVSSIDKSPIV